MALAVSALVGLYFAISSVYAISLLPPNVKPRSLTVALASTHVMLDAPRSLITKPVVSSYDFDVFSKRAALYGNILDTPPVRQRIARLAEVPPDQLTSRSRLTMAVQRTFREGDAEQRASQIAVATKPYKLEYQADPVNPFLNIYAQAPSVAEAERLADSAVVALDEYLSERARRQGTSNGVAIHQLGPARGQAMNAKVKVEMLVLTFSVAFAVTLGLLCAIFFAIRGWIAAGHGQASRQARLAERASAGGNWPHTVRLQPWLLAGFMLMLWLVPFNAIQLGVSTPIDMKFDRLVLPVLFAVWILALAVDGPASPRLRMTLIHVGIAGFVAAASLSVVLNAHSLNQTLEFDLAFKKVTLLVSYVMLFVIVASSVRRAEIPAFLKYNLVLAVVCALGTVWEYRFHYNVFYELADALLPGIFLVNKVSVGGVDDIGRAMTMGPADHPLEVTGMVTMALPIALVFLLGSKDRRSRILYLLAACVLIAAAISTYRKTALLGPVAVVATIAIFRRRDLLRLAPLGFVSLIAIHFLSPGALGSVLFQLKPSRLGVATVSDRAADYDGIRPDLWTHLAFGRGYGTYDHKSYRVLDSEILSRVVDTGIIGTLALVFMLLAIVLAARPIINSRHPVWSPIALMVAASAVGFLTLTFLFDVSSFPHVPYILLSFAGMLAVVLSSDDEPDQRVDTHEAVPEVRTLTPPRELVLTT